MTDTPPRPGGRAGAVGVAGVAIVALVMAWGIAEPLRHLSDPFFNYGDGALGELAVREAANGERLLGAYSRFGWNHPGPAFFYWAVPFVGEAGSRGFFLAAISWNAAASVGIVLLGRRIWGGTGAVVTSVVTVVMLHQLGADLLFDPWNPYVIVMPCLLLVLLVVVAASGSTPALAGVIGIASVIAQTHLSTAPFAALACFAALGGWLVSVREGDEGGRPPIRSVAGRLGLAAVAGVLLWLPPLSEQFTRSPGNMTRIVQFARDPPVPLNEPRHHPVAAAVTAVGDQAAAWMLGREPAGKSPDLDAVEVVVLLVTSAVAATALAVFARRRAFPELAALAAVCGALIVGVVATTRTVGPLSQYFVLWLAAPSAAIWIVVAVQVSEMLHASMRSLHNAVVCCFVALAAILGIGLVRDLDLRNGTPYASVTEVENSFDLARRALSGAEKGPVLVSIGTHDRWPIAAGVVLELRRDGWDARVPAQWGFLFGPRLVAQTHPMPTLVLANTSDATYLPDPAADQLGVTQDTVVYFAGPDEE